MRLSYHLRSLSFLVHLMPLAGMVACSEAEDVEPLPPRSVTDSAGTVIVENRRPSWRAGGGWQVGTPPAVSVGGETGDSTHLVWRVKGAVRLSDGKLAVLAGGQRKVLVFDRAGDLVRAMGRPGRGPGEFRSASHLQYKPGDTLVVWDGFFGPITSFDRSGDLVGRRQIDLARMMDAIGLENRTETLTPLPDGSFVAHTYPTRAERSEDPPAGELTRARVGFVHVDRDYSASALGGWYGGYEHAYVMREGLRYPAFQPFLVRSSIAAGGEPARIYLSNGDTYEIQVFEPDGTLTRVIRRLTPPTPIPPEERRRAQERWNEQNASSPTSVPEQTHYPAVNGLLVDREGYLWVRDTRDEWSVYDDVGGTWLGRVSVPLVRIFDIGHDYVLGVWWDEFEVEHVREYPLYR